MRGVFATVTLHTVRAMLRGAQTLAARWANRAHHPDPLLAGAAGDLYKAYLVARDLPVAASVLDLGCGSCSFLQRIRLFRDFDGHGIDLAPLAQEHFTVKRYDGRRVPYSDRRFDLVIIGYVLHHLEPEHAAELVREALRVTKPGGRVVIFEDSLRTFDRAYHLRNWLHHAEAGLEYAEASSRYVHPQGHRMFLTHTEWQAFLNKIPGVRDVRIESLGQLYSYQHHSMIAVALAEPLSA